MQTTYVSPAKLNIFLKVVGALPNNYHKLQSIFCKINLYDVIRINMLHTTGRKIIRSINNNKLNISFDDDLCIKTIRYMQDAYNLNQDMRIHLHKNIPIGAGLGGGSSNAAQIIKGLNEIFSLNLSIESMCNIGKNLGADIPFFIQPSNVAFVEGIGEKIKNINNTMQYYFIIIKPSYNISTASIFKALQTNDMSEALSSEELNILQHNKLGHEIGNDLQKVIEKTNPKINEWLASMKHIGLNFQVSGSGSCLFAMFNDKDNRDKIARKLNLEPNWYYYLSENIL